MGLSIGFSLFLYSVSSHELQRSLRIPERGGIVLVSPRDYESFRIGRLDEADDHLRFNLLVFNLVMLLVGGMVSAALAKKTLEPIETAMKAQSRFTADASHELRTPLTVMQTEIEVALRKSDLSPAKVKELLESNLEEVIKLRNLSDNLLKLARDHNQDLELQTVSIEDIGTEAMTYFVKAAQSKQISIENNLKPLEVQANQPMMTEVLGILLDNAIKYSPNKTTITISCRQSGNTAHIDVVDQGQGISQKDLPHIFERFYRSDISRTKNTKDGYGLGLSIAKQMVELQGGTITVASTIGKGSTFTISLANLKQT